MLLLDTCTLLWLASGHASLSSRARTMLAEGAGTLHVSAISAFEIGIKARKGALSLPLPPGDWYDLALKHHGLLELPVSGRIACRSTELPMLHSDPCDRILVATAQLHRLKLLTPDASIAAYPDIDVDW